MATKVMNGLDLQSQRVQNVGDPSSEQDAATKAYVDAVARGLDWKASVRAASTGNVTISSAPSSIDGVTLASGDRVLLKDQTAGSQNGIYTFSSAGAALVRALDADSDAEVTSGMAVTVTEGTANNDKIYVLTTADPIVLGTSSLSFAEVGGGGGSTYLAGNGLTESPAGTFNVGAGTGISVNADTVAIDPNVVPRKYAANVGDGTSSSIVVNHSLNSRDVTVEVFTNVSPYDTVLCDVEHTDANTVTLKFATAPASGAYRVVVVG